MAKGLEKSFFNKIQNKLLVKNSADLNRNYLLVIFIHSPLFSFLLYDGNLKLLLVNILVSLISGLIILTSYYSEKVKNNIANIVYIFFYAVIVYACPSQLRIDNDYKGNYKGYVCETTHS